MSKSERKLRVIPNFEAEKEIIIRNLEDLDEKSLIICLRG